eukprot:scaffold40039_cov25-Tisochrysis_lutea.AAC.1
MSHICLRLRCLLGVRRQVWTFTTARSEAHDASMYAGEGELLHTHTHSRISRSHTPQKQPLMQQGRNPI